MTNWQDWIGRTQTAEDILTPGLLTRFRATIDSAEMDLVAPQGIHWCLCVPDAATAQLGADGHPVRDETPQSFLPPVPLPRRMWASSAVKFLAPIAQSAAIARTSTVASVKEKSGSTGSLVFVEVDHVTTANGVAAVEERQTIVYREATTTPAAPAPDEADVDLSGWGWHRSLRPAEPVLFRYSALTFNSHRIHYDRPYAVDEECYRGLVVHGPLTATLLLDLAARELGANRLRSFAFRGVSPAIAGEPLHLVAKRDDDAITLAALGGDGRTVMAAEGTL
ncbi:MAG: MaoC family dehydratase N-terminal domain-containing protein [Sphingomonadales bacterium]|nr:MaoC family dehydratase N-terminal domain-containing protein [Sphingomonadales bacterium]